MPVTTSIWRIRPHSTHICSSCLPPPMPAPGRCAIRARWRDRFWGNSTALMVRSIAQAMRLEPWRRTPSAWPSFETRPISAVTRVCDALWGAPQDEVVENRRFASMTDVTAAQSGGFSLPGIGSLGDIAKRGDLALAVGVLTILMVLILPLPAILLDFSLAISIILSVLILMTALFIHTPLEFSSFPTVLLISTMLRLALNLASTRLILARGHEGTAAAGHVIEAFGNFVMSGNFVIGIIVFIILVIVNFVVITKGSGCIAEVHARVR